MSVEENKALVRKWIDGGPPPEFVRAMHDSKSPKELAEKTVRNIVVGIFAPDVLVHVQGADVNREALIQGNAEMMAAFPDISFSVEKMAAEGDLVAAVFKVQGTHTLPYMGIPAVGKKIESRILEMFRIAGGKVVEVWMYADAASMMQQLGITPKQ